MRSISRSRPFPSASRASGEGDDVQAVARALRILSALGAADGPLSITVLSSAVALHASTVHRLLHTLVTHGFARQDPETSRYGIGPRAFEVGSGFVAQSPLREMARPHLKALRERTGETANLAVLDRGEVIYVEQEASHNLMRMFTQLGRRVPVHCTGVGKVLIAGLDAADLEAILRTRGLDRFTPATITRKPRLIAELRRVRDQGYALDREEREVGVRCVAAPVHDLSGRVVAAVSISAPAPRLAAAVMPERIAAVTAAADAISRALGWPPGR